MDGDLSERATVADQSIRTFSNRVWGGWAFALLAGWTLVGFGLVNAAFTPDLWQGIPGTSEAAWGYLATGLVLAGGVLIVVATLKAEFKYLALKANARDQQVLKSRRRQRVLMGLVEQDLGIPEAGETSVVTRAAVLVAVLTLVVVGVLTALGWSFPHLEVVADAFGAWLPDGS